MFCFKCGNEINKDAAFCSKCGSKVRSEGEKISREGQSNSAEGEGQIAPKNIKNNKYSNKAGRILGRIGSTILALLFTVILPGYLAISFLANNPIIAIILLIAAIILVIVIFKREPKKMAYGIGGIIVAVGVIAVLSMLFNSNFKDKSDKYVEIVKNGILDQYPQKTVGDAFDNFLEKEVWESGITEDGIRFVNVSGELLYADELANVIVQFMVDEENESFTYNACEIDGVPQNNLIVRSLFNTIYNSDSVVNESNEDNKILIEDTQYYNNEYGNMEVTLEYVEFDNKITDMWHGYKYPDEGCIFMSAMFCVKNVGTENSTFLTSWNKLVYDGMYEYNQYTYEGEVSIDPLTSPETIKIVFMVPEIVAQSESPLILNINDISGNLVLSYVIRNNDSVNEVEAYNQITEVEAEEIFERWLETHPLDYDVEYELLDEHGTWGNDRESYKYTLLVDGEEYWLYIDREDGSMFIENEMEVMTIDYWYAPF